MRIIYFIGLAIIAIATPLTAAEYSEVFDKIDVDKILSDEAIFNEFIDCFLDKHPCSSNLLIEFKKIVPDIVSTACEKCTPSEKAKIRKLVSALYERKPNRAVEFHNKYDPTGENEPNFAAFLIAKDD